jgi:phenylalanyl-tRNA synthetase beta chain
MVEYNGKVTFTVTLAEGYEGGVVKANGEVVEGVDGTYTVANVTETLDITVDGVVYGTLAVLHPAVKAKLDRKAAIAFAEVDMGLFAKLSPRAIKYVVPSRFPAIEIDFSFLVNPAAVDFDALTALCRSVGGELLRDVSLVDVYEGKEGDSSIALRFVFASPERTLTKAELSPYTDAILAALAAEGMSIKE